MTFNGPMVNGLKLMLTKHGLMELEGLGLTRWQAAEILTFGWDCSRSKRKEGTIERCHDWGNKVIRAVAKTGIFTLGDEIEQAYYLVHISVETRKKGRKDREG